MQFTFTKQLSSKNVQTLYKLLETENNVKIKNQPSNLYSNYCKNNNVLQSFCILNKDEVIGCAQLFFYLRYPLNPLVLFFPNYCLEHNCGHYICFLILITKVLRQDQQHHLLKL